jgi:phosphoribosyl-AMP cyclohydrolase / phosphoribosyl-ATP pyrophosphohydrolase
MPEGTMIAATPEQLEAVTFNHDGLVPVVAQDIDNGDVLMMAWMNRESLAMTLSEGRMVYWSRSRQELWRKGDTSGDRQFVREAYYDCDGDTLLFKVEQEGAGACHTGARTCFFTRLGGGDAPAADGAGPATLEVVERVLQSRVAAPPPGSYVAGLLAKGEAQICRKIGEEAIEVVTAALGGEGDERVVSETADLWFHSMVLLARRGIPLRRVFAELARRHAERAAR